MKNNLKILSAGILSSFSILNCGKNGHNGATGPTGPAGQSGTGTNGTVPTSFLALSNTSADCSATKQISITVTNNDSSTIACMGSAYDASFVPGGGNNNSTTTTIAPNASSAVTINIDCDNNNDVVIEDIICWNENGMGRIASQCACIV